jgi:hypothetical protein
VNNPSKKDRAPYQVTLNGVVGLLADNLRCDPVRGCASHHAKSSVVMGSFCIHLTGPRNLRISRTLASSHVPGEIQGAAKRCRPPHLNPNRVPARKHNMP